MTPKENKVIKHVKEIVFSKDLQDEEKITELWHLLKNTDAPGAKEIT